MIDFGSVCAGVGGMDKGLEDAGMKCAWQIEIDKACQQVLAAKFKAKIYDDATKHGKDTLSRVRVLAGGTPCQGFSISGLRAGLADDRSNVCLHYCRIADELEPDVLLWENVPGALSMSDNAFGCFIAAVVGYDTPIIHPDTEAFGEWWRDGKDGRFPIWPGAGMVVGPKRTACWRILDSQYFGLAQRRRRLFVIADSFEQSGRLGIEEFRERIGFHGVASAILFEPEMLRRHSPPSRKTEKDVATALGSGTPGCGPRTDPERMTFVPTEEISYPVMAGAGGSKFGSGRDSQDTFAVGFDPEQITSKANRSNPQPGDPMHTLGNSKHPPAVIGFEKGRGEPTGGDIAGTLRTNNGRAKGVNDGKADNQCVALGFRAAGQDGFTPSDVSPPIAATDGGGAGTPCVVSPPITTKPHADTLSRENALVVQKGFFLHSHNSEAMKGNGVSQAGEPAEIARALDTNGGFASNQGGNVVSVCLGSDPIHSNDLAMPQTGRHGDPGVVSHPMPMSSRVETGDVVSTLTAQESDKRGGTEPPKVLSGMCVRRLTPVECERLQGFNDDWTSHKELPNGKLRKQKDSPRYRQIGNAVSSSVAYWFGKRIIRVLKVVDSIPCRE